MKRLAFSAVLALLLSGAALAQFPPPDPIPPSICDSNTNLDTSGNYCVNFEVEAGDPPSRYAIYTGTYYEYFLAQVDYSTHDEVIPTTWPGLYYAYWGSISFQYNTSHFNLPEDPLLILGVLQNCGGPCGQNQGGPGYIASDLVDYSGNWSFTDAYTSLDTACIGYRGAKNYSTLTRDVKFGPMANINNNGYYPYNWSGEVVITFNGTPHKTCGRTGCYCTEQYASVKSWGEASSVHQ